MHLKKTKNLKLYGVLVSIVFSMSFYSLAAFAYDTSNVKSLIPVGRTAGIKMMTDGVVVSKMTQVTTSEGAKFPAYDAGLKEGDVIKSINGSDVSSNQQISDIIQNSSGNSCKFSITRDDKNYDFTIIPLLDTDNSYKIGVFIRDSMAGIGTITFVDPKTKEYGSLGHGICDIDTGVLMPFKQGDIMPATISEVQKGVSGNPGSLHGQFDFNNDLGKISANRSTGIYGTMTTDLYYKSISPLPIAKASEVKVGPAQIISNIQDNKSEKFDIEIIKLIDADSDDNRNIMIKVTSPDLISRTGGIVQGMSGSPIIQDGKFIGAVTHVLVNDPQKGYGILIENMINTAYSAKSMHRAA